MKILIAGCGFVGSAVARRFAQTGHAVWGLRREPSLLPPGIAPIGADLTVAGSLASLPDGLDIVVYCASPDRSDAAAYADAYVAGVRNLLTELDRRSPRLRRFLLTSSTGIYGRSDGAWVDESTPPEPASAQSERLLEGEQTALRWGFSAVVVRLGGLYGPGRRRLLDNIRAGKEECIDGQHVYTNRIHRDDAAGVVVHLAMQERVGELYLGVDDDPAERCEVLRWLAARLDAPEPRTRPGTQGVPTRANKRCSNRRLRSTGYSFLFPTYREGYADVLAQLSD